MYHYRVEGSRKALCGNKPRKGFQHRVLDRGWSFVPLDAELCPECAKKVAVLRPDDKPKEWRGEP